jgi:hypothetical protein
MRSLDDLSTQQQIALFRDAAKELRAGGKDAEWIKPEYQNGIAATFEDLADRIEAGEDPFAEEEESPEELRAQADALDKIIELMERENVKTLGELFERYGVVFEEGPHG